jgi:NAD(P)-dependent dehydrogenase (short-subunit alcohol dehydrogenase family)
MERVNRGIRVNAISPGYTATPMNLRPQVTWRVSKFEANGGRDRQPSGSNKIKVEGKGETEADAATRSLSRSASKPRGFGNAERARPSAATLWSLGARR